MVVQDCGIVEQKLVDLRRYIEASQAIYMTINAKSAISYSSIGVFVGAFLRN